MVNKLTNKHISYSDSIVMKELEKIAIKENLIEFEEKIPEIKAEASNELNETGDVFLDSITLAKSLRDRGFVKQASLLERRALELKAENTDNTQYSWWQETGESLLDYVHKTDKNEPLPSMNDYGRVEDEVQAQKKILETLKHEPKGVSASKKIIIDEINIIAQENITSDNAVINAYKNIGIQLGNLKKLYPATTDKTYDWGRGKPLHVAASWANEYKSNKLLQMLVNKGTANAFLAISPKAYQVAYEVKSGIIDLNPNSVGKFITQYGKLFPNIKPPKVFEGIGDNKNGESDNYKVNISRIYDKFEAMYKALTGALNTIKGMLTSYQTNIDKIIGEYNEFSPEAIFSENAQGAKIDVKTLLDPVEKIKSDVYAIINPEVGASLLSILGIDDKSPEAYLKAFDKSVEVYKLAVYSHPKIGQLGTTFKDVGFGVDALNGSVDNALSNWSTILNKLKDLPNWENDEDFVRMVSEASDNVNKLSKIKNALDGINDDSPYGLLYNRISDITNQTGGGNKQSIGTDVGSFLGFVNTYARDGKVVSEIIDKVIADKTKAYRESLEESKRSLEDLSKTQSEKFNNIREARSDPSLFGGGGGDGGDVKKKTPAAGGGGRGVAPKKVSKAVEKNIQVMQKMQEDFAAYAGATEIKEGREPAPDGIWGPKAIAQAIHTAKENLKGANPDGIWGPNTQASLESIQKYIDANPDLKGRIKDKIHSAKPSKESDAQLNKNVKNNIIIIAHAQALLGDPKYDKSLPNIINSSGFDNIPYIYTVPTEGNTESFMPIDDGIKISARELSSLGQLKGYLDSKGYTTSSSSGKEKA